MYDPQIEFAEPLIPRELTFERRRAHAGRRQHRQRGRRRAGARHRAAAARCRRSRRGRLPAQQLSAIRSQRTARAAAAAPRNYRSCSSRCRARSRRRSASTCAPPPRRSTPTRCRSPSPICAALAERLTSQGCRLEPLIMLSNGGVIGARVAGTQPGAHDRERPRGRRARRRPHRPAARHRKPDLVRHGRHHRQGLPDRGRRTAGDRRVRGRSQLPLQARAAACRLRCRRST